MKKWTMRLLSLVLALVMCLCLAGCQEGKQTEPETEPEEPKGPAEQIGEALQEYKDLKNLTMEMQIEADGQVIEATMQFAVDLSKRELTMVIEMEMDGQKASMALYNGYMITEENGQVMCQDMREDLNAIFDAYEEAMADMGKEEINLEDMDWEALIKQIAGEDVNMDEVIHTDKITPCLLAFLNKFNDVEWLEENAGYKQKEKDGVILHKYDVNLYDFIMASVKEFKDIFVNPEDYREMIDAMEEDKGEIDGYNIQFAFGIKDEKLFSLELEVEDIVAVRAELSKPNKTDIDTEALQDMLDKALEATPYAI